MLRMDGVSPAPFASLWVPWVCGEVMAQVRTRRGGGMGGQRIRWGGLVTWHAVEPILPLVTPSSGIAWVLWWCARATTVVWLA